MVKLENIVRKLPSGTSGAIVLVGFKWHGVAANWNSAGSPVYAWRDNNWVQTRWKVARSRGGQNPHAALAGWLSHTMDENIAERLVDSAIEIPGQLFKGWTRKT